MGERAPSSFSQSQRKAIIVLRVKLEASWEGLTTHTLGHTNATDCWYTQRWFTSHIHTQASVMSQGLVECYRCWRCGKGRTTEERSKGHLVKKWLVLCFFSSLHLFHNPASFSQGVWKDFSVSWCVWYNIPLRVCEWMNSWELLQSFVLLRNEFTSVEEAASEVGSMYTHYVCFHPPVFIQMKKKPELNFFSCLPEVENWLIGRLK